MKAESILYGLSIVRTNRHRTGAGRKDELMEAKKNNKKVVLGVVALVALIAVFAVVFAFMREKPVEGAKTFTVEVVDNEQKSTTYTGHTDAEYLRQALEELEDFRMEGSEGDYGLYVQTVNGVTADNSVDGSYWSFYVNGEICNYGVDTQPVEDGDAFKIVYEIYAAE